MTRGRLSSAVALALVGLAAASAPSASAAVGAGAHASHGHAAAAGARVDVTVTEWAMRSKVRRVFAGEVTFVVRNKGRQPHEFVLLRTGRKPSLLPIRHERVRERNRAVALGRIRPGAARRVTVSLKPGRYVALCNLRGHYERSRHKLFRLTVTKPPAAGETIFELATSGQMAFNRTQLAAPAGRVTIRLTNKSVLPHNVAIKGNGLDVRGPVVGQGEVSTVSAELEPGTYRFYCSVEGHEAAGMWGTLTVTARGEALPPDTGTVIDTPIGSVGPATEPQDQTPTSAFELTTAGLLAYDRTQLTAVAGEVTIRFTNASAIEHDIGIRGNGIDVRGSVVGQGGVSTVSATLAPGTYIFYCSVEGHEEAGMWGTLTVVAADATPPPAAPTAAPTATITAESKPANPTTETSASFAWTTGGGAPDTTTCDLDGGGFSICASPKDYIGLSAAQHTFTVKVCNVSGCGRDSYTWTINPPPPTVAITPESKPADPTTETSATFAWTTDGGVFATTTCDLDGGGFGACASPKSYSALSLGQHTFTVKVCNVSGCASDSYTWTINPPPPTVAITPESKPADGTTATSASFAWTTGGGAPDTTTCDLDGGGFSICASPKDYIGLSAAQHTFTVKVCNVSGCASDSYTWTITGGGGEPPPPPTVAITAESKPADPTTDTSAGFAWTTGGGVVETTTCDLDGGGYSACSAPKSYSGLSAAQHTFTVKVCNVSGCGTDSYTWTIALPAAPTVAITAGSKPADPTTQTSASFAWTTGGVVEATSCDLDGAGFSACSSPKAYAGLSPAQHTFTVHVCNTGGCGSDSYTWTINPPPPTVAITAESKPADLTPQTSASFAWTTGGGAVDTTTCDLDGAGFAACSSPKAYAGLAAGRTHAFTVKVCNVSGCATDSYSWRIPFEVSSPCPDASCLNGTNPDYAYNPKSLTTSAGGLVVRYTNNTAFAHNFAIKPCTDPTDKATCGGAIVTPPYVNDGASEIVEAILTAGSYRYYCSISGHENGGTWGTLTVTG